MIDINNPLTQWVINKIKSEYPDDIALLVAVEGSSVNNDGHGEPFDYFIPSTQRGNELAQTFIIGGVGNDLYPRTWERTERTADLDDLATICLGNARILYARTEEDEARFERIRQKLFENLGDPEFTYKKALENLDVAMDMYRTMMFDERLWKVRCLAGYIQYYLQVAVSCLNGTYWKAWHYGVLPALTDLEEQPDQFSDYYKAILAASTVGELRSIAHLLIASTRRFIARYKPHIIGEEKNPDYTQLVDWYQELRTTWNRIYYFCEINDADAAFVDACTLQNELSIIAEEFNLNEMDLLGCFDIQNLAPLSNRASEHEGYVVSIIEQQGIEIKRYKTLEDFLTASK